MVFKTSYKKILNSHRHFKKIDQSGIFFTFYSIKVLKIVLKFSDYQKPFSLKQVCQALNSNHHFFRHFLQ